MNEINTAHFWQTQYQNNVTPWDLGKPVPVFERLAKSGRFPLGKLIVLGAGYGYDAHLFARYGFDVTAVDFAVEAVAEMQRLMQPEFPITILQTDIFELPDELTNQFDYILEYTCYCAIDPERRDEYAALAHRLLRKGGQWIALSFPIGKRPGGPPYVVQPDRVIERMEAHQFKLLHREMPPDSAEGRQNIEELLIMEAI